MRRRICRSLQALLNKISRLCKTHAKLAYAWDQFCEEYSKAVHDRQKRGCTANENRRESNLVQLIDGSKMRILQLGLKLRRSLMALKL